MGQAILKVRRLEQPEHHGSCTDVVWIGGIAIGNDCKAARGRLDLLGVASFIGKNGLTKYAEEE